MTSLLDSISSQISPHTCILCCVEGNIVCSGCIMTLHDERLNTCWYCSKPARMYETCQSCLPFSALDGLFVIGPYENHLKDAIHQYKYSFAQQLSTDVVNLYQQQLPFFEACGTSYVPSSNQHCRQRGFDQGMELAKAFSRSMDYPFLKCIERWGKDVQVGSDQKERASQAQAHFKPRKLNFVISPNIFLFDDVVTTGASINRCAEILKQQGAKTVFGVALARNILK